jgi:proline/betaine transport protein TphA
MGKDEKRSVLAGLYGNALEWYDFLLYASFAPIFAELFFPTKIEFISLITTFGVFAISFFMRPIGGFLIGHYADHAGRRQALILSVSIMTTATTCIAFLPTFHQVGIFAPLLFTLFRLIQGIAVGGELPGTATFLIEHTPAHRRGFAGSLILSTAFLGIFAGSFTASWVSYLVDHKQLYDWGWRLPYLIGGVLGVVGILLRIRSVESPSFLKAEPTQELPAKLVFLQHKKSLILAVLFTSIMALSNYVLIAYATTFLVKSEGFELNDVLIINLLALLLLTLLIPIMGLLSDRYGRKPIFVSGLIGISVFIFPFFWLMLSKHWWYILCSQLLLSIILAPLNATVPTIIAEMFPTPVRASGTALGYNLGQALFGGTVPLIAFTLIQITGAKIAPAWYILAWSLVVLMAVKFFNEDYRQKLA